MNELGELITTLERVRDAVVAKDKDKGFEAVTIFLIQFMGVYGDSGDFIKRMFPILEHLKNLIQSEQYEDAIPVVLALLSSFREARESWRSD